MEFCTLVRHAGSVNIKKSTNVGFINKMKISRCFKDMTVLVEWVFNPYCHPCHFFKFS
jgi:hypothetical protein